MSRDERWQYESSILSIVTNPEELERNQPVPQNWECAAVGEAGQTVITE